MQTRNSDTLASFARYCERNPDQRFWQALRNWSGYNFVYVSNNPPSGIEQGLASFHDTFYWEGKNKHIPQTPNYSYQRLDELFGLAGGYDQKEEE